MRIRWNAVTWYSWVAAIVLFVGTFALGLYLGERLAQARSAADASGEPCGGALQSAPQCPEGYRCLVNPRNPDIGGTCEKE